MFLSLETKVLYSQVYHIVLTDSISIKYIDIVNT